MPTTLYASNAAVYATRPRRAISDKTVALAFAAVPFVLFALAVAFFGFDPTVDLATAFTG